MKTISIEDDLFLEIDKLATGIFSHSDVIRKLLGQKPDQKNAVQITGTNTISPQKGSIVEFVHSSAYQALRKTGDRYLVVLSWVNKHRPQEFSKVGSFQRGKRTYFAKNSESILESGKGNIKAKQIPGSSFWALVTLDSPSMRNILADVLQITGFKPDEINLVVKTIQGRKWGAVGLPLTE